MAESMTDMNGTISTAQTHIIRPCGIATCPVCTDGTNATGGEVRMASIASHIERSTRGLTGAGAETARPMTGETGNGCETGNGRETGNGCIEPSRQGLDSFRSTWAVNRAGCF